MTKWQRTSEVIESHPKGRGVGARRRVPKQSQDKPKVGDFPAGVSPAPSCALHFEKQEARMAVEGVALRLGVPEHGAEFPKLSQFPKYKNSRPDLM